MISQSPGQFPVFSSPSHISLPQIIVGSIYSDNIKPEKAVGSIKLLISMSLLFFTVNWIFFSITSLIVELSLRLLYQIKNFGISCVLRHASLVKLIPLQNMPSLSQSVERK